MWGLWSQWVETVSTELPHPHSPSFPFVRVVQSAAGGATVWHKHGSLPGQWSAAESYPGDLHIQIKSFFSPNKPPMFLLYVCQNKALSGFTHRVYCDRTQYIVRSGHARDWPICLCWVQKWELPLRRAGELTDQGRESGFGFSLQTVITLLLWTLIWKCGSSLTLYYNSIVIWGLTVEATWISSIFWQLSDLLLRFRVEFSASLTLERFPSAPCLPLVELSLRIYNHVYYVFL